MPKVKFDILESTCIPLPLENVDTDQIIPARFLSATSREIICSVIGGIIRPVRKTMNLS
jgi:3-isopropylmalate dehydratase small subunit